MRCLLGNRKWRPTDSAASKSSLLGRPCLFNQTRVLVLRCGQLQILSVRVLNSLLWFGTHAFWGLDRCDENLTKQIEAGYKKFQPLKITPMPSTPVLSNTVELTAAGEAASVHPINPDATRWPLFGPHLNQFVIFAGDSHAWLLNDMITSKLTRTLMTKLTNGENLGGTKLLRGYPEVLRTTSKAKKAVDQKKKVASKPDLDIKEKPVDVSATERMTKDVEPETLRKLQEREQVEDYVDDDDPLGSPDRKLDHLVFVIHGIGQKLSARTDVVNFVHGTFKIFWPDFEC